MSKKIISLNELFDDNLVELINITLAQNEFTHIEISESEIDNTKDKKSLSKKDFDNKYRKNQIYYGIRPDQSTDDFLNGKASILYFQNFESKDKILIALFMCIAERMYKIHNEICGVRKESYIKAIELMNKFNIPITSSMMEYICEDIISDIQDFIVDTEFDELLRTRWSLPQWFIFNESVKMKYGKHPKISKHKDVTFLKQKYDSDIENIPSPIISKK